MNKLHDRMVEQPPLQEPPVLSDLLARAVAHKLEADPSLLRIPLKNIDRWISQGVLSAPEWFRRWRELLERARHDAASLRSVLIILRTDTEEARRWRDFSPFAGVLSAAERRTVIRRCNYSH
jgi:hypothetical protein